MVNLTDTADLFIQLVMFMKVNTKITNDMAKENTPMQMDKFKKEDGRMVSSQDIDIIFKR